MNGGGDAACGLNIWVRKVDKKNVDENSDSVENDVEKEEEQFRYINLGAKNTASMRPGERIIIHTPGGGGWGKEGDEESVKSAKDPKGAWIGGSIAGRQSTAEASA
jgi:5-oxoprolinase (ATP-hydrolysing)